MSWETLRRAADRLEPRLRKQLLAALEAMRDSIDLSALIAALEAGRLDDILRILQVQLPPEVSDALKAVLATGAAQAITLESASLAIRFDRVDEVAAAWAERYSGQLITNIDESTREAVREIVTRGQRLGLSPRDQARSIQQIVGLTRPHARAVDNFIRAQLEAGVDAARVDRLAERMARRLLRLRAEMIARTETITASTQGQLAAWREGMDSGQIPRSAFKVWIVTPDNRVCPICAPRDGMVVEVMGSFVFDSEAVGLETGNRQKPTWESMRPLKAPIVIEGPPAHPGCRCAIGLSSTVP